MSKTIKEFRGVEYTPKERGKKFHKDKFMGYTSGTHSHKEGDEAPIKGVDFIKYGYPDGGYPKRLVIAKKKNYPRDKHKGRMEDEPLQFSSSKKAKTPANWLTLAQNKGRA